MYRFWCALLALVVSSPTFAETPARTMRTFEVVHCADRELAIEIAEGLSNAVRRNSMRAVGNIINASLDDCMFMYGTNASFAGAWLRKAEWEHRISTTKMSALVRVVATEPGSSTYLVLVGEEGE